VSAHGPYPVLRPYYKGHSREEDEKLAEKLFFGTSSIDKKTSRERHDYLLVGGPDERRAFEALERLLVYSCGDLKPCWLRSIQAAAMSDVVYSSRGKGNDRPTLRRTFRYFSWSSFENAPG
jgi:hypothetical protein